MWSSGESGIFRPGFHVNHGELDILDDASRCDDAGIFGRRECRLISSPVTGNVTNVFSLLCCVASCNQCRKTTSTISNDLPEYYFIINTEWTIKNVPVYLGTCEASWFDSISNRTYDSRFDSYWWSDSKFLNRPRCESSFVKKRLVVVKLAFKVDFGSKISVQQHCSARFMTELK